MRSRLQPAAWFPLLAKELFEQAGRRRTYIIRFLYGALLFGGGLVILYGRAGGEIDVAAGLGQGIETFRGIVELQFAAIYVFLPAMTAGALTLEKERDTLTLLFLTTMSPWTILLQKLGPACVSAFNAFTMCSDLPKVAFLAMDAAKLITGGTLYIDGGYHIID